MSGDASSMIRLCGVQPLDVGVADMRLVAVYSGKTNDPIVECPKKVDPPPSTAKFGNPLIVPCVREHQTILRNYVYGKHGREERVRFASCGSTGTVAFHGGFAYKYQRLESGGCCSGLTELRALQILNRVCEVKRLGEWVPRLLEYRFVATCADKRGLIIRMPDLGSQSLNVWLRETILPMKDSESAFRQVRGVLFQIIFGLVLLQRHALFYHNDLHSANVMIIPAKGSRVHFSLDYGLFELPMDVPQVVFIDLGYCRVSQVDESTGMPTGCVNGYGHSASHEETWSYDLRRVMTHCRSTLLRLKPEGSLREFLDQFPDKSTMIEQVFPHVWGSLTPHQCLTGEQFEGLFTEFRRERVASNKRRRFCLDELGQTRMDHVFLHSSDAGWSKAPMRTRFLAREFSDSVQDLNRAMLPPLPKNQAFQEWRLERVLSDVCVVWLECTENALKRCNPSAVSNGAPHFGGQSEEFEWRYRRFRLRMLQIVCRCVYRVLDETGVPPETPNCMPPHLGGYERFVCGLVYRVISLLFLENPVGVLMAYAPVAGPSLTSPNKLFPLDSEGVKRSSQIQIRALSEDPHGYALCQRVPCNVIWTGYVRQTHKAYELVNRLSCNRWMYSMEPFDTLAYIKNLK